MEDIPLGAIQVCVHRRHNACTHWHLHGPTLECDGHFGRAGSVRISSHTLIDYCSLAESYRHIAVM